MRSGEHGRPGLDRAPLASTTTVGAVSAVRRSPGGRALAVAPDPMPDLEHLVDDMLAQPGAADDRPATTSWRWNKTFAQLFGDPDDLPPGRRYAGRMFVVGSRRLASDACWSGCRHGVKSWRCSVLVSARYPG